MADRHANKVCVEMTELEGRKSNEWRAKQLFALISLLRELRHTQAPQGEHSSLKLTFALHWEGKLDTVSSCVGSKKCLFPIFYYIVL